MQTEREKLEKHEKEETMWDLQESIASQWPIQGHAKGWNSKQFKLCFPNNPWLQRGNKQGGEWSKEINSGYKQENQ